MTYAKKRFGQHFLTQPNTIAKIINAFACQPNEPLLEIGPGRGALTKPLLQAGHPVTAIEIDRDVIAYLQSTLSQYPLDIIAQDILKVDLASIIPTGHSMKVIGNLPYNISTPILFHLLESQAHITSMIFMLQKEVVDRLAATPGNKHYGRLSVMVQRACRVEALFDIPPTAFSPPPKVMSTMVRLSPYHDQSPYPALLSTPLFADVVRLAFGQRRKTLRNALKTLINDEQWSQCHIDASERAENLSIKDFIDLSNYCHQTQETS